MLARKYRCLLMSTFVLPRERRGRLVETELDDRFIEAVQLLLFPDE